MSSKPVFKNFDSFYVFYLREHQNVINRRLHFLATLLFVVLLFSAIIFKSWILLVCMIVIPYALAWTGHFIFEKNKPATFHYVFYSLLADFRMAKEIFQGKVKI